MVYRRQIPDYQGGFILDGGIHLIAGLRYLLNGLGQDVSSLAAYTALVQPKLAPVDTVHAILATDSGRSGTFSVSFGAAFQSSFEIVVVTTKGRVSVTPTSVVIVCLDDSGKKQEQTENFTFSAAVAHEVEAFATSIQKNVTDPRATPQQALKDLTIIQSMLDSGGNKVGSKQILL
jgi:predicted dehydrogenase